jgi:hypothetical protein
MTIPIRIFAGATTLEGEFFDTACGRAMADMLPIEARPHEWGDEFYFEVPVKMELDGSATTAVKVGDIGYWPPGAALAIFFGPTPLSVGDDPVPASAVNIVGRIITGARDLRKERGVQKIRIEKA